MVVLEITLSKVIMFIEDDCGTVDNSFKNYHVYRGMIVVL